MLAFASCISIRCPPPLTSPGWSGRPRRERVASEPVCEAAPPTPAPAVPTSLQALTTLAAKSVSEALKDGEKRIRITALPPTLNPVLENSFPYSAQNLHILVRDILLQTPVETSKTSILFASAGQAASAKAQYKKEISVFAKLEDEEDDEIAIASYYRRDFYEGRTKDVNFIVSPVSNRGDSVMDDLDTILSEAPDAVWVLVNAALTLDRAAVGMSENKRRQDFLESFTEVFYFRNLFEISRPRLIPTERGVLLYLFRGPWHIYALEDTYTQISELENMPSSETLTSVLRKRLDARKPQTGDEPVQTGVDAEAFRVLAACGLAFTIVYAALAYLR